jgi:dihydrofolate reductase
MIAFSNWYNKAKKIVLSMTMKSETFKDLTIINDNLREEILKIKKEDGKNILIFGSPVAARALMQLDLIDRYWVFVNPLIFGRGVPLFLPYNIKLKLNLNATETICQWRTCH